MASVLHYRAGPGALARIRDEGLRPSSVRCVVGPASGPRWLALAALDRALIRLGLGAAAAGDPPRLLVGASAGAWRALALAARDPDATHRRLVEGYVGQVFRRGARPDEVSAAYDAMLARVFPEEDLAHALARPATAVAVHAVRLRGPVPWAARAVQAGALVTAGLARRVGVDVLPAFAERVLFHSRPSAFRPAFAGRVVPLTVGNARAAALASGTVPVYLRPVRALPGGPRGAYVDGGLADYHLRQRYLEPGTGITLFPHFQRPVLPGWFDRVARTVAHADGAMDDVLQAYPSPSWVATLPGARLPDRDDFFTWVDDPDERIRRWTVAVERSEDLAAAFVDDVASGAIARRVRALDDPGD